jgi:hypothetical protein
VVWLGGVIALTVVSFVVTVAVAAPSGAQPAVALRGLLFLSSSVHVGASGWFYTVPEVRRHMGEHRTRYIWVPIALILGTAALASVLEPQVFTWLVLAFYAWQFFHFQKQNLGMAALAGAAGPAGSLRRTERRAIMLAGIGGIAGLVAHPDLLQLVLPLRLNLLFLVSGGVFAAGVLIGVVAVLRRPAAQRPWPFLVVYVLALLFFLPVFLFASPYAAVAGLTLAHGYQYLFILVLLAGARTGRGSPTVSLLVLFNVALVIGLLLNVTSHLHGAPLPGRALYGAYLGVVMAHFVIDAGIWRLREKFPRGFLTERLPYLLVK